jgi:hypothetical protein
MGAVAWYARGHVIRPIRIFAGVALAGLIVALVTLLGLAGFFVPGAVLAMTASLALAFSVNRRWTRRPRRPAVRRAGWIVAAAIMLAAMPVTGFRDEGGFVTITADVIDVGILTLVAVVAMLFVVVRLVRGIVADRGDRLLVGALSGVVLFVVLWVIDLPTTAAAWSYPFWILLGAADARAYGNIRRP